MEMVAETVSINVTGMKCAACQAHVQKALEKTKGVEKAQVSLLAGEATVAFDPQVINPKALVTAIAMTGYQAKLPAPSKDLPEEEARRAEEQSAEVRDLTLKAVVTLAIGALAMALSMQFMHNRGVQFALLAASIFAMLWAGRGIYTGAFRAAIHGSADMNALIALGTGAAFLYSAVVTLGGSHRDVYYEAVIFIL